MLSSEHSMSSVSQKEITEKRSGSEIKTFVFGILLILTQIVICFLYGFFVVHPERSTQTIDTAQERAEIAPVIISFLMYFLVLVGFGLVFSYEKKLIWSAIGFNLLITCITVQWFFLFNFFWTKVFRANDRGFDKGTEFNNIYLSNALLYLDATDTASRFLPYGATLIMALKASLANCVAFSSILGKAGPLEALLLSIFGTFGFEVNRNLLARYDIDFGEGFAVFAYGGFLGLTMGLFLALKYRSDSNATASHPLYTGSSFSGALSFFGACVVFALFPIILFDSIPLLENETYSVRGARQAALYTGPQVMWYSISSGVIVASAFSALLYGKIIARDMINGVVAGGVCAVSASFYLGNPVWAMLLGTASGILQMVGQSLIQKVWSQNKSIINTYSFTTIGAQAILGGVWSSIFRAVIQTRNDDQIYELDFLAAPGYSLAIALLSAAMGIAFGILLGIIFFISGNHKQLDHFHDYTYWVADDGIRYALEKEQKPVSIDSDYEVEEVNVNVKEKHAYL